MVVAKRSIGGRDFWFTAEQACKEDPNGGEARPIDQYYCVFSVREPGPLVHGEVLQDGQARACFFQTADQAIAAGIKEVQARLGLAGKFTVGLPYGNKDAEFQVYVRLLREQGIDPNKPRVEDSYGRRWLHLWDNREDAERFAVRLRQESRNPDWEVYEFSEPGSLGGDHDGQGPIEILVGRQGDGRTYGLHPNSSELIRRRFPSVHQRSSVFMGGDVPSAYEGTNGTSYDQIALLLTGLSMDKLAELGGYRIVDPITRLVLHGTDLIPAEATP